jgi:tRNA_anti-like
MTRLLLLLLAAAAAPAQNVPPPAAADIGEAEVRRVEEKVAVVRRDILSKYELSLGELQSQFQKAADLDGALAARAERERVQKEAALSEKDFAGEPKALRALQQATLSKMQELVAGVVVEALPKLIEYKNQLTIAGRLDDAVTVRTAIERVQNANVPVVRAEAGSIVPVETLLRAYHADRSRADKTYKGVRLVVRGTMAGYRLDPDNAKNLVVYVTGAGSGGWVQCGFNLGQMRYREDRQGNATVLVLSPRDGGDARLVKGMQVDILGECNGWDETVKLAKCDVAR